jgi:hypothetical protein
MRCCSVGNGVGPWRRYGGWPATSHLSRRTHAALSVLRRRPANPPVGSGNRP